MHRIEDLVLMTKKKFLIIRIFLNNETFNEKKNKTLKKLFFALTHLVNAIKS